MWTTPRTWTTGELVTKTIMDTHVRDNLEALFLGLPERRGTSLPGSPVDGEEYSYLADDANGVIWRFKYRSASASSFKWEFIGGPPKLIEVTTSETTNSSSYADLATVGPDYTTPLAGDWLITISATASQSTGNNPRWMSFAVGGTAASDDDCTSGFRSERVAMPDRTSLKTSVAASTLIRCKYKTAGADVGTFSFRRLMVRPVRVQ